MLNYVWERLLWSLINKEEEIPNNHYHVDACETQLAKWIKHSLENIKMKQRKCKQ